MVAQKYASHTAHVRGGMGSALTATCTRGDDDDDTDILSICVDDRKQRYTPRELAILRDIERLGVPPDIIGGESAEPGPSIGDLRRTARHRVNIDMRMQFPKETEPFGTVMVLFYTADGISKVIRCAGRDWQALSKSINRIKNDAFGGHFSIVFEHSHPISEARDLAKSEGASMIDDHGKEEEGDDDEEGPIKGPSPRRPMPWKSGSGWFPRWSFHRPVRHVVHYHCLGDVHLMWADAIDGWPQGRMEHLPVLVKKSQFVDSNNFTSDQLRTMSCVYEVDIDATTEAPMSPRGPYGGTVDSDVEIDYAESEAREIGVEVVKKRRADDLFDMVPCVRGRMWVKKCTAEVIPFRRMKRTFIEQGATRHELHRTTDILGT